MGIVLHFHFHADPVNPVDSEGSDAYRKLRRHGLDPLLSVIEYSSQWQCSLSGSGHWLKSLEKKELSLLKSLVESARLQILPSPMSDPSQERVTDAQIQSSIATWNELEIECAPYAYLPRGARLEPMRNFAAQGIKAILIPDSVCKAPLGGGYQLDSGLSLLPAKVTAAEFLERGSTRERFSFRTSEVETAFVAYVIEIRPEDCFDDRISLPQAKNALLELFKDLRGDFGALTGPISEFLPPSGAKLEQIVLQGEEAFASALEIQSLDQSAWVKEKRSAYARMLELEDILSKLSGLIAQSPNMAINQAKYDLAKQYFALLESAELWEIEDFKSYPVRKAIAAAIVRTQVEADTILHPQVDPTHGWIEHRHKTSEDQSEELVVDSQLKRLYFRPSLGGAMTRFEYKPRKVDLANSIHPEADNLSFIEGLVTLPPASFGLQTARNVSQLLNPQDKADLLVTAQTQDLFGLRLRRNISLLSLGETTSSSKPRQFESLKLLNIKAGIGAYLNNATTGISFECWVEADDPPPENSYHITRMVFMLPSGALSALGLRPLSSFGGTSDKALPLAQDIFLSHQDIEGGLYGTRLIDGVGGFVMDIRTSKPLSAAAAFPLLNAKEPDLVNGLVVLFYIDARRVFGDDKTSTLFLSIM